MNSKRINRREFMTGMAVAAAATVIVSCAPGKSLSTESGPTAAPLPLETSTQPTAEARDLRVLIVYDSVYGNTAKIAEALIAGVDVHDESRIFKAQDAAVTDLTGIDLLLVGSPTHGGTFTEPVKNFLNAIPDQGLNGIKAAAFDTSFSKETQGAFLKIIISIFGVAAPKIADTLEAKGADVLAAETFIVLDTEGPLQDGEIERSEKWARELIASAASS